MTSAPGARLPVFGRLLVLAVATTGAAAQQPPPAQAARQATAAELPIQIGVTVQPETVTVGDPFLVRVRVRAPRGAGIVFPDGPADSTAPVEALDTRRVATLDSVGAFDQTATYRMAAWDVGDLPIGLGEVLVRAGDRERRASPGRITVHVASVLPADTAADRSPRPERPLVLRPVPWWLWLLVALALALVLGLLVWAWRRRRRAHAGAGVEEDPYVVAEREFARVESLGLVDAGERGRFVALMVEVLRRYLARRVPGSDVSLTSTELLAALRGSTAVPLPRLAPVLAEADLVKFARRQVTAERARQIGAEVRAIAREVNERLAAEEQARLEAAARAEQDARSASLERRQGGRAA